MKALVTGGGGFLGRRIVELLRERGDEVTFLARGSYPEVEATGARGLTVDLRDRLGIESAVQGHDAVFHVAAKAVPPWGDPKEFWAINVDGTRNVLDACEKAGVPRVVYTSTPSVVGRTGDVACGGPDLPYPDRYAGPYGETKAEAERMVMAANSRHLATVSLRPPLIFGPRDPNLLPRVIDRGSKGRLRIIGDGHNVVDLTYVDNAAWAHLDALAALTDHTAPCAGRAYFVSNAEPYPLWQFINELLVGVGQTPVTRSLSYDTARRIGAVLEWAWTRLPLPGEPPLTPIVVDGLAKTSWYDAEPARRDLGYRPRVPMAEAIATTIAWFRDHPV